MAEARIRILEAINDSDLLARVTPSEAPQLRRVLARRRQQLESAPDPSESEFWPCRPPFETRLDELAGG